MFVYPVPGYPVVVSSSTPGSSSSVELNYTRSIQMYLLHVCNESLILHVAKKYNDLNQPARLV
jgi:hypothetical protein